MAHRLARAVIPLLAFALLAAACSSGNDSSGGSSSGGGSGGSGGGGGGTTLTIQGFAFHPDSLSGPAGSTLSITITNKDDVTHSFTLDDNSVTKDVPSGQTVTVQVPLPNSGTLGWHCRFHPTMTGTISVA